MAAPQPGDNPFQEQQPPPFIDDQFDIFDWYPYFQSCVRYFLEHAQYDGPIQALAAFINIQLPFQRAQNALLRAPPTSGVPGGPGGAGIQPPGFGGRLSPAAGGGAAAAPGYPPQPRHHYPHPRHHHHPHHHHHHPYPSYQHVSLHPYIRRLVATGFDQPAVLHGFFGDDWELGVRPLHEQERRNYLFAAKSGSWLEVKRAYDMPSSSGGCEGGPVFFSSSSSAMPPPSSPAAAGSSSPPSSSSLAVAAGPADETVPFLRPLRNVTEAEIVAAEAGWSEWLAMQDWMLGPRSVGVRSDGGSSSRSGGGIHIKREED
ncbi:hypothetical protein C7999DRAFT_38741 [Corynascus novoguineensis]|uniref:Ilp is an apoptosis inhibitor n=1 Tax=Corynascus novoguineensis TaxID=1126955 RepID=A0AAN7CXI7_9PEZI|nr:hypothetical protein C7999DRAFT_38741 [Corynascus novoguineensis]